MGHSSNFSIVRFAAHPARDERLNVGIVVFHPDRIDVRVSKRLDRVRALSAALDVEHLRESLFQLAQLDDYARSTGLSAPADRLENISSFVGLQFSPVGAFEARTSFEYEDAIANLLQKLVEPEPAPIKMSKGRPSRLLTSLKRTFKQERILARKGENLDSHRIIAKHKIVDGLEADLVLRNGSMHIFETVDAASDEVSLRKVVSDIAVSALVFEQARMTFGDSGTITRLIYQASSAMEASAQPALDAAQHQGAELINWESNQDRVKFINLVTTLATPIPDKKSKKSEVSIHASTQGKFLLN